jgi:hypothetical protein
MTDKSELEQIIRDLQATPEVVLLSAELGPPASPTELEALRGWFGCPVPEIEALYAEVNGVQLRWMAARSPRYVGSEASFVQGAVPWTYALYSTVENKNEDGVLILPPIATLLAQDWSEELEECHNLVVNGEEIDAEEARAHLLPFDWSGFYQRPAWVRETAQVAVGTDHGIDWCDEHVSFDEHLRASLEELENRRQAARRGDTSF